MAMSVDHGNRVFPVGKSLADDASTVNYTSDGETFASEADPMSLHHESDLLLLERASEHSRILTDDEASDTMWVSAIGNARSLAYGASSVNTGSTYDETPFLPSYDGRMVLKPEPSWNDPDQVVAPSHSAQDGYACEMLAETEAVIHQAKASINDRLCNDGVKQQCNDAAETILGGIRAAFSACNDQIDEVLIRIFNVHVKEVETRPSYVVSLDESLTEDLRTFSDALMANKSQREVDAPRKARKHSKKDDTFLVPVTASESQVNTSLDYSYSDMNDDILDEVLSDNYNLDDGESSSAMEETSLTVQSCAGTEDTVAQEFNRLPHERIEVDDVPFDDEAILDNEVGVTESRDDETATLVSMEPEEEEIISHSSKAKNDLHPNKMDGAKIEGEDGLYSGSRIQNDEQQVDTSYSRIHSQRVEDLINKNLQSTNRPGIIDLSRFEIGIEGTLSTKDFPLDARSTAEGPNIGPGDSEIDDSIRRRKKYRSMMKRLNLPVFDAPTRSSEYDHTSDINTDKQLFEKSDHEACAGSGSLAQTPYKMQTAIDLTMFEDFL